MLDVREISIKLIINLNLTNFCDSKITAINKCEHFMLAYSRVINKKMGLKAK